ncbi:MAG: DUF5518 domain-containing protein [Halobacteriaceae archaeon]
MVSESQTVASKPPSPTDEPNALLNALVGAAVTVVTAPLLPLAAVVGGGVAGYLQRGTPWDGAKVGALSGAIASLPALLVVWFVVGIFFLGVDPLFGLTSLLAAVFFVVVVGYLVGAGALGGALGAYVREEL